MIDLQNIQPSDSGFYFMNYYDSDEIRLHTLKINSKNEIISKEDKEIVSEYKEANFSIKLPDYITPKFIKSVNEIIVFALYNVDIEFSINDTEGWDESFSVFVKSDDMLHIFTQELTGKVSVIKVYGKKSLSNLQKMTF
jgi:hypothetical protein